jgi:hypothetical protein
MPAELTPLAPEALRPATAGTPLPAAVAPARLIFAVAELPVSTAAGGLLQAAEPTSARSSENLGAFMSTR